MTKNNVGKKIVAARKNKGLSQEALSAEANISLSTIQRIEKGTVQPRSFTLKTLATALEIDFAELIATEETISKPSVDTTAEESPILKRMVMAGMLGSLIPFGNIIIPILFWKKKKALLSNNSAAGNVLSFQILWTIAVVLSFFLADFVIYLITGLEGYRPVPVELFVYLFFVILNLIISLKQVTKLNAKDLTVFSFVPNFF